MKSVLIIGAGQFGIHIAKRMAELRCEIMVVDSDEGRINSVLPYVANAQIGNSTNADFMQSLGIPDYDVCIVTISDSFQNSLETTALLKDLGAKKVISRAQNDVQEKFLLRNGADETVYPEKQMAVRLATKEAFDDVLDVLQLDRDINIYEVRVPRAWNNRSIAELDITGDDLMAAGVPGGKAVGECLGKLLELVLKDPTLNKKDILLKKSILQKML